MKLKLLLMLLLTAFVCLDAYSQNAALDETATLVGKCREISALQDSIDSVQQQISLMTGNLQKARKDWSELCKSYMDREVRTKEDLEYLKNNTDSVQERELLKQLNATPLNNDGKDLEDEDLKEKGDIDLSGEESKYDNIKIKK